MLTKKITWNQVIFAVPLFFLLCTVFLAYSNRVDDLDLWWHLKTGELIARDHTIPTADSFSYTSDLSNAVAEIGLDEVVPASRPSGFSHWAMNLNHSWLGQLLLFLAFQAGGIVGIGLMKSSVFVLCYLFLWLAMKKRGAGNISAISVLALVAYIGHYFNYSRPQIFSFFLFGALFFILADSRRGGRLAYLLPPMVLIWANLHGGFILGVLVILLFALGETVQYLLGKCYGIFPPTLSARQVKILLLLAAACLLASLCNPNGYLPYLFPLATKNSLFGKTIEEYHRPMLYEYHTYWFMLLLVGLSAILRLKRLRFSDFGVMLFLAVSSLIGIRAIIFFTIGAAPFLAYSLTDMGCWLRQRRLAARFLGLPVVARFPAASVSGLILGVVSLVMFCKIAATEKILRFDESKYRYPAAALSFIREEKLPGPIFNSYNWGGYMIWKLPEYRVFIDGRCLNETAYFQYMQIIRGSRGKHDGPPLWKRMLDAHNVQLILTNAVDGNGYLVPLVDKLAQAPEWELVYQDGTALLFLRHTEIAGPQYKKLVLPKREKLLNQIVRECQEGISRTPATWGYYETLGNLYLTRYEIDKAREMFSRYLLMNPYNNDVREKLNMIVNLPQGRKTF